MFKRKIFMFKKILSLTLVLCMMMTTTFNVFAQEPSRAVQSVNINGKYLSQEDVIELLSEISPEEALVSSNQSTRSMSAGAVVYFIPGIGEVAVLATGAIVVAGVTVVVGSWLYNVISDWLAGKITEVRAENKDDEIIQEALDALDDDSNKQNHIKQPKHDWDKVIAGDVTWKAVKKVIKKAMDQGVESTYKGVTKRVLSYKGKEITVTFRKITDTLWRISDAWVNN